VARRSASPPEAANVAVSTCGYISSAIAEPSASEAYAA